MEPIFTAICDGRRRQINIAEDIWYCRVFLFSHTPAYWIVIIPRRRELDGESDGDWPLNWGVCYLWYPCFMVTCWPGTSGEHILYSLRVERYCFWSIGALINSGAWCWRSNWRLINHSNTWTFMFFYEYWLFMHIWLYINLFIYDTIYLFTVLFHCLLIDLFMVLFIYLFTLWFNCPVQLVDYTLFFMIIIYNLWNW